MGVEGVQGKIIINIMVFERMEDDDKMELEKGTEGMTRR